MKCKYETSNGRCGLKGSYAYRHKCFTTDLCKCHEPMTNAQKIRSMSDEELGNFLLSCCDWNLLIDSVCEEDNCAECHDEISTCTGNCLPAVVKWLKQPAE